MSLRATFAFVALMGSAALASAPDPGGECTAALGAPRAPQFSLGEHLEYDLDALGADAGKLSIRVGPTRDGTVAVEVTATTNSLFSKVRRVNATATSFLDAMTLRPRRYVEESRENEISRSAEVSFRRAQRQMSVDYTISGRPGRKVFSYAHEALDPAGAIFLLRHLPMKEGASLCFDAYGIRNLWRVTGRVVGKERVSLKIGEFEAWHIQGEAMRPGSPRSRREIHLWVSADDRRLPLAAVGVIDIGAVRATLVSYARPEGSKRAQGKESLKW